MKSKITGLVTALAGIALPFISFAQVPKDGRTGGVFIDFLEFIQTIIGYLMPIVTAILIILFGWNLIQFLSKKENIEDAEKFKKNMFNSLIALFIWFVLISLINVIAGTFNLETGEEVKNVTQVKFKP